MTGRLQLIGVVVFAVAAAAVIAFVEYRAKAARDRVLTQLQASEHAPGRPSITWDDLTPLVSGAVRRGPFTFGQTETYHFKWNGLLKSYAVTIETTPDRRIVSYAAGLHDRRPKHTEQPPATTPQPLNIPAQVAAAPEKLHNSLYDNAVNEVIDNVPPDEITRDLKTVEKVRHLSIDYRPQPIPADSGTTAEDDHAAARKTWYRKNWVEVFRTLGSREASWYTDATRFLETYADHTAAKTLSQVHNDLDTMATRLLDDGCSDPLVVSVCCRVIFNRRRASQLAQALPDAFVRSPYSARTIWLALYPSISPLDLVRFQAAKTKGHPRTAVSVLAVHNNAERRILLDYLLSDLHGREAVLAKTVPLLICTQTGSDEWLKQMLVGNYLLQLGSRKLQLEPGRMTTRPPHEIPIEQFIPQSAARAAESGRALAASRSAFLNAWNLQPNLPQAAVGLIRVAANESRIRMPFAGDPLHGSVAGEPTRFWFDQAVAAQMDYPPAYRFYLDSLLFHQIYPDRPDLRQRVIDFGRECLRSERFDTQVPAVFLDAVHMTKWTYRNDYSFQDLMYSKLHQPDNVRIISPPSTVDRLAWSEPGLYEDFNQLMDGYADTSDQATLRRYRTMQACLAYLANRREEAVQLLDDLGDNVAQSGFDECFVSAVEIRMGTSANAAGHSMYTHRFTAIMDVQVHPVTNDVYTCDGSDGVRVWNAATGYQSSGHIPPPDGLKVNACDLSSDGSLLVVAGGTSTPLQQVKEHAPSGFVQFWNPATGKLLREYLRDDRTVLTVRFSPDDLIVATGSRDRIIVWDAAAQRPYNWGVLREHNTRIPALAFSSDGRQLASISPMQLVPRRRPLPATLKLWDLPEQPEKDGIRLVSTMSREYPGLNLIRNIQYLQDDTILLSTRNIQKLDPATGQELQLFSGNIASLSPDRTMVAVGASDVGLHRADDLLVVRRLVGGHTRAVLHMDWGADGRRLATASINRVIVWDTDSGQPIVAGE